MLEVQFVLDMMEQLQKDHAGELGGAVVIHSDQGSRYTSCAFRKVLSDGEFIQSMSRRGNCWVDQPMECFFSGLKDKDHIRRLIAQCRSYEEVIAEVARYIDYYNNDRYQWKLAKLSPAEFYNVLHDRHLSAGEEPHVSAEDPETRRERANDLKEAKAADRLKQQSWRLLRTERLSASQQNCLTAGSPPMNAAP